MIRAIWGDAKYWDKWIAFDEEEIRKNCEQIKHPSRNPNYRPQFIWDTTKNDIFRLILCRYSRGDPIQELGQCFPCLLDMWELSNKLANELNAELNPGEGWDHQHLLSRPLVSGDPRSHNDPRAWVFNLSNLNHYNWCFWLIGLALALDIPDAQWQRLLALIGGEGEDVLLDRVIASRQLNRKVGTTLLHAKPYARLLKAIDAPKSYQPVLLKEFVDHWYDELARRGKDELWWYIYGDPVKHPLEMGSYFGRWCIEAVAAAKAFGLDDSLCLGHEYYPGDLLRPNGPTTHPQRAHSVPGASLFSRIFGRK